MLSKKLFRTNNFDILRLIAALQVALNHAIPTLNIDPGPYLKGFLYFTFLFPGVPIFFFISGFLISKSFENNHRLSEYFQNRILRLYPGLFFCVSLSFLLIFLSGYMATVNNSPWEWIRLFVAKTTFVQFYNPDFMRAYGDGVLNGSLWTISVELQFYILIPILYFIFKIKDHKKSNLVLIGLIAAFLVINRIYKYIPDELHHTVYFKLFKISFLPWIYMFLTGVLVQRNFELVHRLFSGKFAMIFPFYLISGYGAIYFNIELGNNINPFIFVILIMTVFSFAYSYTSLNEKLLKRNDISYGVYIFHMPIINYFLYSGYSGKLSYAFFAITIAIIIAMLSWVIIEKNSLKLKKHPLNPLNRP